MRPLFQKLFSKKVIPVFWTLLTIGLLCLPGSTIPGDGLVLEIPHLDKIVHVVLFGGIVLFWSVYYAHRPGPGRRWRKLVIILAILSTALGIVLEYVQFYFIPQRSFDRFDIVADASGALAAMLYLLFLYPGRLVKD
jgi:hypothetical protein